MPQSTIACRAAAIEVGVHDPAHIEAEPKETLMLGGVRSILNEGPAADFAAHSTIHVEPALSLRSKGHSARIVRARPTSPRLFGEHFLLRAGRAAPATSIHRSSCPVARPSTASPRTILFFRISQFSGKGSNVNRLTKRASGLLWKPEANSCHALQRIADLGDNRFDLALLDDQRRG